MAGKGRQRLGSLNGDKPVERANPPGLYRCPICGETLSGPPDLYRCPAIGKLEVRGLISRA